MTNLGFFIVSTLDRFLEEVEIYKVTSEFKVWTVAKRLCMRVWDGFWIRRPGAEHWTDLMSVERQRSTLTTKRKEKSTDDRWLIGAVGSAEPAGAPADTQSHQTQNQSPVGPNERGRRVEAGQRPHGDVSVRVRVWVDLCVCVFLYMRRTET